MALNIIEHARRLMSAGADLQDAAMRTLKEFDLPTSKLTELSLELL